MAVNLLAGGPIAPVCSMCRVRPSRVRTFITVPLVESLSVWCCDVCYPAFNASVDRMRVDDPGLVVVEVAA